MRRTISELQQACDREWTLICLLTKHLPNLNLRDREGWLPLEKAMYYMNQPLIDFLVKNEANILDVRVKNGQFQIPCYQLQKERPTIEENDMGEHYTESQLRAYEHNSRLFRNEQVVKQAKLEERQAGLFFQLKSEVELAKHKLSTHLEATPLSEDTIALVKEYYLAPT